MKKNMGMVMMAGVLALVLCACSVTGQSTAATVTAASTAAGTTIAAQSEPATAAAMPQGYEAVADPAAIEARLNIFVSVPQQAQDITYGIVGDGYAYMSFTFEGAVYRYSVGKGAGNVHADGATYAQHEDANWLDYPYALDWNEDGSGRASWFDAPSETSYQLTAADSITRDKLSELAVMLIPAG